MSRLKTKVTTIIIINKKKVVTDPRVHGSVPALKFGMFLTTTTHI